MKKTGAIRRVVRKGLGALLVLLLLSFLWLVLIVGQPQETREAAADPTPLPAAGQALRADSEADLPTLAAAFPAPFISFMSGSGMVFVSGSCEDVPFRGGYARVLTQYWQTAEGSPMILQSIFPASALEIMGKRDYSFSGTAGPVLFGQPSVRMENADTIRLHAADGTGLHVITLPKPVPASLPDLTRSLQLFQAEKPSEPQTSPSV